MSGPELVGHEHVVAKYASGAGIHGRGRVIAYTDEPTYVIEADDGTRFSWLARLTDVDESVPQVEALVDALMAAVDATPHPQGVIWPEGSVTAFARRLLDTGRVEVTP